MNLPSNVKIKRFPWTILPILSTYTAHAIYPNIYIPQRIYADLKMENPDPKNVSVLIHEQTHIERQNKMGWLKWGLYYFFSPKFRLEEELEAIQASMKYLKSQKLNWDTERSAKFLSSYLYLWCVNYKDAKQELDKRWASA